MARETLRELAGAAGAEFIRRRGRYAEVRWPDGASGFIELWSKSMLRRWGDMIECLDQAQARDEAED